jgi:ADP-ribosylglycohydrolase
MDKNRIQGCLIGVAVGDSLGSPWEGVSSEGVRRRLKSTSGMIDDFYPPGTSGAWWTDDTGMTLATARALIKHEKTGKSMEKCFREAFYTWINSDESRNPGRTVTHAAKYGIADKNSYATGALMRTSPVAIYAHLNGYSVLQTAELAYWAATRTHGHPLGTFPAVECTLALFSILQGDEYVPSGIDDPECLLTHLDPDQDEERALYRQIRHLATEDMPPASGLAIWKCVLEERLGLLPGEPWASLPPFREGILQAVNDCPDRDTSGAVAGGILGAYWGLEGIPETWRTRVEKADQILALADELIRITKPSTGRVRLPRSKG